MSCSAPGRRHDIPALLGRSQTLSRLSPPRSVVKFRLFAWSGLTPARALMRIDQCFLQRASVPTAVSVPVSKLDCGCVRGWKSSNSSCQKCGASCKHGSAMLFCLTKSREFLHTHTTHTPHPNVDARTHILFYSAFCVRS